MIEVEGASLEAFDWGSGEPVVFIQTALGAEELRPLAQHSLLGDGHRKVLYHRRGYAGSSPAEQPGSIQRDAADCRAVLAALGIERAHIVGYSYSAAVALQLAIDAPACTRTLILLEPPPTHTAGAPRFRELNEQFFRLRREQSATAALHDFLAFLDGADWRQRYGDLLPGSVEQMERDAATFFDIDMPALLAWDFDTHRARRISCPVLYVGATNSGQFFAEVRELMLAALPHVIEATIPGADHSFPFTHSHAAATALHAFLRANPL